MIATVCNSSSSGNTIVLHNDTSAICLDAGVNPKEVKKTLNWNISLLRFALCTHVHLDHSRFVSDYLRMGVTVYMPPDVKQQYANERLAVALEPMKRISHGDFRITPFKVPHDDVENYAYIIEHEEIGKTLYMVDCEYCPYDLSKLKLNNIFIECNYSDDLLEEDIPNKNHIFLGHMELKTTKEFLRVNKSEQLRNVILCHLSNAHSDPNLFISEIESVVDCEVHIAEPHTQIFIDDIPFM